MKRRYSLLIFSAIYIGLLLLVKIPTAMNNAVDKAVEKNKPFVHAFNVCDITLQNKKYKEASECFGKLLKEYDRNDVRYNYAFALTNLKEYEKAKEELEIIIETEKNSQELLTSAKKLNNQIDEMFAKLRMKTKSYNDIQDNNLDIGDYYNDLEDRTKWEKPTNITVYINDDPQKELFEKAFTQWNGELGGIVYFQFVNDKKANIVCSFVDKVDGDEGGFTDWYYFTKGGVKYFQNVNVQVAKYSPIDGKLLTDKQIYSIILHEIGHALGISGHSPFKGDIMYFSTAGFLNGKGMISKRDINTVKKLYKKTE